jgi:hypothetical protein
MSPRRPRRPRRPHDLSMAAFALTDLSQLSHLVYHIHLAASTLPDVAWLFQPVIFGVTEVFRFYLRLAVTFPRHVLKGVELTYNDVILGGKTIIRKAKELWVNVNCLVYH